MARALSLIVALALLALLVMGAIYEALSARTDSQRYPPPGKLIPAEGTELHLNCTGAGAPVGAPTGAPVVVLEAGLGDSSLVWAEVQSRLSSAHRVCSYDRAGIAWSNPGGARWNARIGVAQLHTLLHTAGEPPPYVLVGHSAGANYVRLFALTYPEETKALILIEPPIFSDVPTSLVVPLKAIRGTIGALSRVGLIRLLGRLGFMKILFGGSSPPLALSQAAGFLYRPQSIQASITELDALRDTIDELNRLSTPSVYRDLPLTIISAQSPSGTSNRLTEALDRLVQLSHRGKLVSVNSSHFVHFDNPQMVVRSIEQAIKDAQ